MPEPIDFSTVRLATPRLVLRPLETTDAPALFALFSDPVVMRYWSRSPWTAMQEAERFVAEEQAATKAGRYLRLALVPAQGGALVGSCALFNFFAPCQRAEVGYALARSAWGQGLWHEAATALIDFAFGPLQLRRIEADIDPRNTASAASLERLGFLREGLLRERWVVDGEVSDSALYGLLQRDWSARRG